MRNDGISPDRRRWQTFPSIFEYRISAPDSVLFANAAGISCWKRAGPTLTVGVDHNWFFRVKVLECHGYPDLFLDIFKAACFWDVELKSLFPDHKSGRGLFKVSNRDENLFRQMTNPRKLESCFTFSGGCISFLLFGVWFDTILCDNVTDKGYLGCL